MDGTLGDGLLDQETGDARRLLDATSGVLQVRSMRWIDQELAQLAGRGTPTGTRALEMRGKLLVAPGDAYERLSERCRALGYVLLLREDGGDQIALAIPGELRRDTGRAWVAVALFAATVISVLWVGAEYEQTPSAGFNLLAGLPFAASLLGILLAHEMGHYFVARWQGVPATLPHFIPMPIFLLGTMGAVIQIKAPPRNRRALLLLGAAGPLAGAVVAIPVLILGLMTSHVAVVFPGSGSWHEGNSLLYAGLKLLVFGRFLPSGNTDVFINSVAFAGWAGLLVTALNLIPAGQLDGGHVAYALLGKHARWLTWVVVAVLLALSILWQGWLVWVVLVLLLGRTHSVPLDDVTPLGAPERALAALTFLLFLLVFIPIPMS